MRVFFVVVFIFTAVSLYAQDVQELNPFMDWLPRKVIPSKEKPKKRYVKGSVEELRLDIKVEGTIWNAKVPCAIINGEVYKIGDKIEDAEVVDVDKEGVTLMYKKKIYIFPVKKKGGEE